MQRATITIHDQNVYTRQIEKIISQLREGIFEYKEFKTLTNFTETLGRNYDFKPSLSKINFRTGEITVTNNFRQESYYSLENW